MEFSVGSEGFGFKVCQASDLPEIDGRAYVLRHLASGARLLYLQNDDPDKAFSIAFKTPPANSTGVFHILEHSVLCGSRKFPVKEPFVNLLKTSMQTFLNAMTGSDFTIYPVGSINEQDLMNLADVYMDAVLHPNIYSLPSIFMQEGWHTEVQDAEDSTQRLVYNGVVLNEMKGALSDPLDVLVDALDEAMYPDTAYRFVSGGEPNEIPDLSYEEFLNTHSRHYRLDNSYLLLYGNLDAERFLEFLDREYLGPDAKLYKDAGEPNLLALQSPVKALGVKKTMVTAPNNACAGLAFALGSTKNQKRLIAADVLLDALAGSNEAPLKRAILDADLADDVLNAEIGGTIQPYTVLALRGLHGEGAADRFLGVVQDCVRGLLDAGLDKQLLEAALSRCEFQMRERDFGRMTEGVAYALGCLQSWFADDDDALGALRFEDAFAELREDLNGSYFEELLESLLLSNPHMAEVEIVAVEEEGQSEEEKRLARIAKGLQPADFEELRRQERALRQDQERPDDPEDVAKLPRLGVADIGPAPAVPESSLDESGTLPLLRHSIASRGICYSSRYYSLNCVDFEELPYAAVLAACLGKLDTEEHSAAQISVLNKLYLGSISLRAMQLQRYAGDEVYPYFVVKASALEANAGWAASLAEEVLLHSRFLDDGGAPVQQSKDKVGEILAQMKTGMQQNFAAAGHSLAAAECARSYSKEAVLATRLSGMEFYRFLADVLENYEERADDLLRKLDELAGRIFCNNACLLSFAGSDAALQAYREAAAGLDAAAGAQASGAGVGAAGAAGAEAGRLRIPEPEAANRAYIIPGQGSFSATGYSRRLIGQKNSGVWTLAGKLLSLDYLWNEVRVKGGAYGCGLSLARNGGARFYSYRDPNLDQTLARFRAAVDWLAAWEPAEDELEGYIVSTVSAMDEPLKPRALASRLDDWYLSGFTAADAAEHRAQAIAATPAQLAALAPALGEILAQDHRCVVGSRQIIEASQLDWETDDTLMH